MSQLAFNFEPKAKSLKPEKARLSKQCQAIYERLKRGRASNVKLSQIALKYTSRISDLRKAGLDVRCVERHKESGLSYYQLFEV